MDALNSTHISQLLDRHGAALVLYARQWCDVPDDVVQEALIALWQQPNLPANPVAWLYRVVRNGAIDAARANRRRLGREASAAEARADVWFTAVDTGAPDADDVAAALEALPMEQRETIVARLWSQMTFAEIAELTDTSTSTAHRRYVEGLSALRERLISPCHEPNTQPTPTEATSRKASKR